MEMVSVKNSKVEQILNPSPFAEISILGDFSVTISFGFCSLSQTNLVSNPIILSSLMIYNSWFCLLEVFLTALETTPQLLTHSLTFNHLAHSVKLLSPLNFFDHNSSHLVLSLLYIFNLWVHRKNGSSGIILQSSGMIRMCFSNFQWNDYCFQVKDRCVCAQLIIMETTVPGMKALTLHTLSLFLMLQSFRSITVVLVLSERQLTKRI